jgi:hypothetical protein
MPQRYFYPSSSAKQAVFACGMVCFYCRELKAGILCTRQLNATIEQKTIFTTSLFFATFTKCCLYEMHLRYKQRFLRCHESFYLLCSFMHTWRGWWRVYPAFHVPTGVTPSSSRNVGHRIISNNQASKRQGSHCGLSHWSGIVQYLPHVGLLFPAAA